MKEQKAWGPIIGIVLVAVMIEAMLGGLASVASAQTEPTARIDKGLLSLIDEYADDYYKNSWNVTLNQYKAWIATIAWGEGNRGGYTAHSHWGEGSDVFNHKVVGREFRFSTGIGPFQLDAMTPNWPTIKKLNPEESLLVVLRWHQENVKDDAKLLDFVKAQTVGGQCVGWAAVDTEEEVRALWRAVTNTNWDVHRNGRASPDLDWEQIKRAIGTDDPWRNSVEYIGRVTWNVTFTTNVVEKGLLSIDGFSDTWLIAARNGSGNVAMRYYYTYNASIGCEVWVWDNRGAADELRYIFVRDYTTGRLPEHYDKSTATAGENRLEQPALNPNAREAFRLSFPLPNRDPYTACINAVFDHSSYKEYTLNDVVTAYTNETARKDYGFDCKTIKTTRVCGYKNKDGTNFTINRWYTGANFLYYDGHPGYDYKTTDQSPDGKVNVLAAADGTAYLDRAGDGAIYIDHGNGYRTYYRHLSQRNVTDGQTVRRGAVIGTSGEECSPGNPHLHFEVQKYLLGQWVPVDPYGWRCTGDDRYHKALGTNRDLWTMSAKPVDVVLVIDCSGSMYGQKIASAKAAATQFVELLGSQDKVALVSFSTSASLDLPLTSNFSHAKSVIGNYSASGTTNMGDALTKSIDELVANRRKDAIPCIIFLTDGQTNTGMTKDQILNDLVPRARDAGIFIYTLGYGTDVDPDFLTRVANCTGGEYYFAPNAETLKLIYMRLSQLARAMSQLAEHTAAALRGETSIWRFLLEFVTTFMRIILSWNGSNLDLTLIDPNGNPVVPGPGVIYSGNDTLPEYYEIYDPQPGEWTVQVYGREVDGAAEPYVVMVFVPGALMQVQPTTWEIHYPDDTTTVFTVSEIAGMVDLTGVVFAASNLVQAGNAGLIPADSFSFSLNNFRVPAGGSQDVEATLTVPPGTPTGDYTGTIEVTSNYGSATISVILHIVNEPPVAHAGPDQTVFAIPPATTALVTLDGSGSYDPDGDTLTYTWTWDGNTAYGVNPTVELPLGTSTVTLVVNDGKVDSEPDTVDITVLLRATVDFDPDVLNLRSTDKYVTVYIELPPGFDVRQIDVASIRLNGIAPALTRPTAIGDYDRDRIPDLMVKFDASAVKALLTPGSQLEITITGEVNGIAFEGTDTIRVITGGNRAEALSWLLSLLLRLLGWRP